MESILEIEQSCPTLNCYNTTPQVVSDGVLVVPIGGEPSWIPPRRCYLRCRECGTEGPERATINGAVAAWNELPRPDPNDELPF